MSLDLENDTCDVLLHLDLTHTLQGEDKMIHMEEEQFRFSVYTYPVIKKEKKKKIEEGSSVLSDDLEG